jgi:ribonuclease D
MILITESEELAEACTAFRQATYITVDTEFMRESTFWPKLCLVQVGGPDHAVAIDVLAHGIDLQPLYDLMLAENVLKVFHAGRQDVEIFWHQTGNIPTPMFDTQVAAMVCGFGDSVGYETLAAKLAGARIDKSSRFTDWSRRPLSDRQVRYALDDVTHLRTAYEALAAKLQKNNREDWLKEEMAVLTSQSTYESHPESAWKRIKTRNAKPRFLAILREVAGWRETEAQSRDVPRNRILRDEAMLEISSHPPKTAEGLARVRNLGAKLAHGSRGAQLLEAIARGVALPDDQRPQVAAKKPRPSGIGPTVELLRVLLRMQCEKHEVAQRLVANVDELEQIAADDNADVRAMAGWRRELFGEIALGLKHGKIGLAIENGHVKLIEQG